MEPLIIIDFDGIFNPLAQMEDEAVWPDMTHATLTDSDGDNTPVVFSPTVVQYFHSLTGRAEIIWLTTWKKETQFFSDVLGLPAYPWLDELEGSYIVDSHDWWKAKVMASLPVDRPTLWIDDEIPEYEHSPEQRLITERGIHWISPTTYIGLTPDHLEEIEAFVNLFHAK